MAATILLFAGEVIHDLADRRFHTKAAIAKVATDLSSKGVFPDYKKRAGRR